MNDDLVKEMQQFAQEYANPLITILNDINICIHQDEINWFNIRLKLSNLYSLAQQWYQSDLLCQLLGHIFVATNDNQLNNNHDNFMALSQHINQESLIFVDNAHQSLITFNRAFKAARVNSAHDTSQDAFMHVLQHQVLLTGIVEGLIDILDNNSQALLKIIFESYHDLGIDVNQIKKIIKTPLADFKFK